MGFLYRNAHNGCYRHPYPTHVSTLALFNKTGSGKLVRVRQIKAERGLAQTTTTALEPTLP
ncbi:MAG: hypothetical protein IPI56_10575 [Elusimicrobia bacterium]|nr:hypothetical protein [Elusimicrobiota bacterium]